MNTNKRGKKKKDVVDSVSDIWNNRLNSLIKSKGYSQKTFARAYKEKYGVGNQADVNRWVRVGMNAAKGEMIGFPSYDTMKRIADFFDVTVGYLTGETSYETFGMERACEFLGIDEATGMAIERITKLKNTTRFVQYEKANYGKAMCRLLSARSFEPFLGGICELAEAIFMQHNPVDYLQSEKVMAIRPEILDLALKYKDTHSEKAVDVPSDIIDEVIDAVHILSEAESRSYTQELRLERDVKLAKYESQDKYLKLLEELLALETLPTIRAHYYETFSSINELKGRIEKTMLE